MRHAKHLLIYLVVSVLWIGCSKSSEKPATPDSKNSKSDTLIDLKKITTETKEKISKNRAKFMPENLALIAKATNQMSDGQVIEVDSNVNQKCGGHQASYTISKKNGALHIGLNIGVYPGSKKESTDNFEKYLQQTKDCLADVKQVWARYGINYDIEFNRGLSDSRFNKNFSLNAGEGVNNAGPFAALFPETTFPPYCFAILHETAHVLGLPDEYDTTSYSPDVSCLDLHDESWPFSFMDSTFFGFDSSDFMPRHIRSILEPIFDSPESLKIPKKFTLRILDNIKPAYEFFKEKYYSFSFDEIGKPTMNLEELPNYNVAPPLNTCILKLNFSNNTPPDSLIDIYRQLSLRPSQRDKEGRLMNLLEYQFWGTETDNPRYVNLNCSIDRKNWARVLELLGPWIEVMAD